MQKVEVIAFKNFGKEHEHPYWGQIVFGEI
jgi:hypothetical protein